MVKSIHMWEKVFLVGIKYALLQYLYIPLGKKKQQIYNVKLYVEHNGNTVTT